MTYQLVRVDIPSPFDYGPHVFHTAVCIVTHTATGRQWVNAQGIQAAYVWRNAWS